MVLKETIGCDKIYLQRYGLCIQVVSTFATGYKTKRERTQR